MLAILTVLLVHGAVLAEPSPTAIYAKALPSVATLEVIGADGTTTAGTGFLALKDGLLVTSWHVVEGAASVKARFSDGATFDATGVVDFDAPNDVAVLRLRAVGLPQLPLAKTMAKVGSPVYTIGAPNGLAFSITNGIVSQVQKVEGREFYQFTAAISPGSSGSPLLAANGEVIGVVKGNMPGGQSLNFGVPCKLVLALDITLPTTPWAARRSGPSEPSAGISPSAAAVGEYAVTAASDDTEQSRRLAEFLRQQGFDTVHVVDGVFRIGHLRRNYAATLITGKELHRLEFTALYDIKPEYRDSLILDDFVNKSNATFNFAKFYIQSGNFSISATYTFTEKLRVKDLRAFLDWLDRAITVFVLKSDVSTYIK